KTSLTNPQCSWMDHRRTDYPLSGNLQPRGHVKTALTKPPFSWMDHRRTDYPLSGNLQPRGQLKTALTKAPFSWIDHLIRPLQERLGDRQGEDLGGLEVDHDINMGRRPANQVRRGSRTCATAATKSVTL